MKSPPILKNKQEESYTFQNDSQYIIMGFIEGEHPDPEDDLSLIVHTETLARCIKALENFDERNIFDPQRARTTLVDKFNEFEKHYTNGKKHPFIEQYEVMLGEQAHEVQRILDAMGRPQKLVMGDLNLTSIFLKNGIYNGVIDFDLVHRGFKSQDFAHHLFTYCIDKEKSPEAVINWEKVERISKIYHKQDPSFKNEITEVPLMLKRLGLDSQLLTWTWGFDPEATTKNKEYFERRYNFFIPALEAGIKHEQQLIDTLYNGIK